MRTYFIIWLGEVASTVGSALTSFALGLWIYEQTDSVSMFALNMLAYTLPYLVISPLAGALADRWNRKWLMILGDMGAAVTTLGVILLAVNGQLHIGYIYTLTAISSMFGALQWPAYMAAIPMIVPKEQLGRASALSQAGYALSEMAGPMLAGRLYAGGLFGISAIGLGGILVIDFATFLFATLMLLLVPISHHRPEVSQDETARTIWEDIQSGWLYIKHHPSLLNLLVYFAIINFFGEFMYPLAQPLLFETTTPDKAGTAMSIMGMGMMVGIGIMGIWGGPKRRVNGILIPGIVSGLVIAVAGLRPSIMLITVAGFGYYALQPIIEGSDRALWQTKVSGFMQGRVFAMQTMITSSIGPLALLVAGPLADHVFEPAMQDGGLLAGSVGAIIGVGPGRGLALFILILGLLSALVSVVAYMNPRIRYAEDRLQDADTLYDKKLIEQVRQKLNTYAD